MNRLLFVLALFVGSLTAAAQPAPLTVDQIMQDPETWIGAWPSDPFWSESGETLYFSWNPGGQFVSDSLYKVPRTGGEPEKVSPAERRALGPRFTGWHHGEHVYDAGFDRKVYTRTGDLYLHDRRSGGTTQLTRTRATESGARFTLDGTGIVFEADDNLYRMDLQTGALVQLTDLRSGEEPADAEPTEQDRFLEDQQQQLFELFRERKEEREAREAAEEADRAADDPPPTYYTGRKRVGQLQLAPGGRFATFTLGQPADDTNTEVMDYVTESGYADVRRARPKVGAPADASELYVQDLERDTTIQIDLHQIEGAYDVPAYRAEQGVEVDSAQTKRTLYAYGPYWSGDGRYAVVEVRAYDNKDRWIPKRAPSPCSTGSTTTPGSPGRGSRGSAGAARWAGCRTIASSSSRARPPATATSTPSM